VFSPETFAAFGYFLSALDDLQLFFNTLSHAPWDTVAIVAHGPPSDGLRDVLGAAFVVRFLRKGIEEVGELYAAGFHEFCQVDIAGICSTHILLIY
jgi:hypothetical protein